MLTEAEIEYIESVKLLPDDKRASKKVAIALRDIRNRVLNEKNTNCMCGMVYRKIYIKDFLSWYEGYLR
jgi:hypothetical protein